MLQLVSLILIRWIVIYHVDSAFRRWNNLGLLDMYKGNQLRYQLNGDESSG